MGHPLEQGLGSCLVATRLGELAGLPPDEVRRTFYVSLLRHIGCTTENQALADLVGGDEVELSGLLNPLSGATGPEYLGAFLRYAASGRPVLEKVRATGRMASGLRGFGPANRAICEVARALAARLGFDPDTVHAVGTVYERWDGKGMPARLRGGQIPAPVRLSQVPTSWPRCTTSVVPTWTRWSGPGRVAASPGRGRRVGWAALVHDLGRIGIPAAVWGKPRPLTAGEWEAVRLHPYQTGRVLGRAPFLARLSTIASLHHERLDGSGYFRGAPAGQLPPAARVLAAADAYHAMREPRPHRPALAADDAAAELDREVRAGRLDRDGVDAVLVAAGHRVSRRKHYPGGLTAREVEGLRLLAHGGATRETARTLA